MIKHRNIDDFVCRMRNVGEQLIPYTFPLVDQQLENELNFIRIKEVIVDGYEVILSYSKADYGTYFTESLSVVGKNSAFLPFNLVVKMARKFLGNSKLSLIEVLKDNRKIYSWTVCVNKRGIPIDPPNKHNAHTCEYEGFSYAYMDSNKVMLY